MITEEKLRELIRVRAALSGGQARYAAALGVSKQVLSLAATGRRKPSKALLRKLGYEAVTMYRKHAEGLDV